MTDQFDHAGPIVDVTRRNFIRTGLGAGVASALTGPLAVASVFSQPGSLPLEVLSINSFGGRSGDGSDTTPAVLRALRHRSVARGKKIVFPTGRYEFWPDRSTEKYIYASNNDPGMKRIAFPLLDASDIVIDGEGSQFIFHRDINPFVLQNARNIVLQNFSIDWVRPFHNEGKILAVGKEGIDLEISGQFPYKLANGMLYFLGDENQGCGLRDRDPCPVGGLLEFDTEKRETAYKVRDFYKTPYIQATAIEPGKVRIVEPGFTAKPGNTLVFGTTNRNFSAVIISDSRNVKLSDVTIHHCCGMGVIGQRSADIVLDRVRVTPSNGRVVSLPADATHFVNCSGRIEMTNCLFENQLDDATNIHGMYLQISRRISAREIEGRIAHPEQRGFDFVRPGSKLELVHSDSLLTYDEVVVKSVKKVNEQYVQVELTPPLPAEFRINDVFASLDTHPDVVIRNCDIGRNRARGLLLGSRGKILVEGCTFHTPGAAILMEGDARYWFEQAGVRDLTIRKNVFRNCNYGVWGKATIDVGAGIDPAKRAGSYYNRNILIEDNEFQVFDRGSLVSAYSIDGMTIRNNRVARTNAYPPAIEAGEPFNITDSVNVKIEGTEFEGVQVSGT